VSQFRYGLAGPVRAEQSQYLPAVGADINTGQRLRGAEPLDQPFGFNNCGHDAMVGGCADNPPSAR
jgi:hypothetical protein